MESRPTGHRFAPFVGILQTTVCGIPARWRGSRVRQTRSAERIRSFDRSSSALPGVSHPPKFETPLTRLLTAAAGFPAVEALVAGTAAYHDGAAIVTARGIRLIDESLRSALRSLAGSTRDCRSER